MQALAIAVIVGIACWQLWKRHQEQTALPAPTEGNQ